MRHLNLGFALAAALCLLSGNLAAQPALEAPLATPAAPPEVTPPQAVTPRPAAPSAPDWTFEEVLGGEVTVDSDYSPVAMGLGAVAGVVAFNALAQYVIPNGSLLSETILAGSEVAASRIYAVGSAVAGALAGQYIYEQM
jgi:hypothetical protein